MYIMYLLIKYIDIRLLCFYYHIRFQSCVTYLCELIFGQLKNLPNTTYTKINYRPTTCIVYPLIAGNILLLY